MAGMICMEDDGMDELNEEPVHVVILPYICVISALSI
jgi:hypothetical protein